MRLSRLDLTRYGCFTDGSISFQRKLNGKPDLHIIYGDNEAGKSTLLNAYMDLLFGIGAQTPFNFQHPYNTMRIGGRLEFADGEQEFIRIKKPQGSLLDASERPIGEGAIQRELGGLDRERYRTMFSLDDIYLQQGGQNILASKGDLGVLLFSASAGLADLGQRLSDVKAKTEEFYKFHSKKGILRDLKNRLEEIKARRAEFDTQASAYAELTKTRDRLNKEYETAAEEEGRTRARLSEINRLLLALPEAAELHNLQVRLAELQPLPQVPASWTSDLEQLKKDEAVLAAEQARIERDLARVQEEIELLAVDDHTLRVVNEMARFRELRSRSVGSCKDLPLRREERIACQGAVEGILARLERPAEKEPERLLLSVSKTGALQRLIESWSGVAGRQQTAAQEREKAEEALSEANEQNQGSAADAGPDQEKATRRLSNLLRDARTVDYVRKVSLAESSLGGAQARLDHQMKLLSPWSGSPEELLALECPSLEQVQNRRALLSKAAEKSSSHTGEYERLDLESETLEFQLGAITKTTGILSDQDLKKIRDTRDTTWLQHKQDLEYESAVAFEAAMAEHDQAMDNRVAHLTDVERHRQLQERLTLSRKALAAVQVRRDTAVEAYRQMRNQITERVAQISLSLAPFSDDLAKLEVWLSRRENAIELWQAVTAAEQIKKEAEIDLASVTQELMGALDEAGQPAPEGSSFKDLLALAQGRLEELAEKREIRRRIDELHRTLAERQREEQQAERAEAEWHRHWAEACSSCWVGEIGIPDIDTVRAILAELPRLQTELSELKSFDHRIRGMESNEEELHRESQRLAAAMKLDIDGSVAEIADRVERHMKSVQETVLARAHKTAEQERYKKENSDLLTKLERHTARKAEMAEVLGVGSLPDIELRLVSIEERDTLAGRVADLQTSIMRILGKGALSDAEAALASAVQSDLDRDQATLEGMLPDQQKRTRALYAEFCAATDRIRAIGADAKIAELDEERRTILIEIQERAEEYLRLRAGAMAAEIALQAYRERHRSTMLQRASDTFRRICSDQYAGLETHPNGTTETLVARVARGGSRTDQELSDGARRQLYFSLRIAGFHEFVRHHSPLPFIADDVLESFDNDRAGETFRLLAEMSELGQVVYLTHHEHLCEIAREVCPSVSIYQLEQDGRQAGRRATAAKDAMTSAPSAN